MILEIEVGVVGGEEDGVSAEINEKLYTTVEDGLRTVKVLGTGEKGRYIAALTFGNVHGVYKPGAVKLRPEVLKHSEANVIHVMRELNERTRKGRGYDMPAACSSMKQPPPPLAKTALASEQQMPP